MMRCSKRGSGTTGNGTFRQRDLWAFQLELSRLVLATGDISGALDCYRTSVEIQQRLLTTDPGNPSWQRSLSLSYKAVAKVPEQRRQKLNVNRYWKQCDLLDVVQCGSHRK